MIEPKKVLGVYSDTGLNSVELSLIKTDGVDVFEEPISLTRPYPHNLKDKILKFIKKHDFTNTHEMQNLSEELTTFHIETIKEFIEKNKRNHPKIDLIGYSGHVVYHQPTEKINITIGNMQKIADTFQIPLRARFIQTDFQAGGCGGPLFASYYDALTRNCEKPIGIISLGGIVTMTYIGPFGELQAFDTGIGTALLDHWVYKKTGEQMDYNGKLGQSGTIDQNLLKRLLKEKYLQKKPPKTVTKESFIDLFEQVEGSSTNNGATTITAFIAHSINNARKFLNNQPKSWILIGGGVYNPTLIHMIKNLFKEPVLTTIDMNWQTDTLNAQCYAFLATRSEFGLPISFPQTSGTIEPVTGGTLFIPTKN